jgi:hypothetical protein
MGDEVTQYLDYALCAPGIQRHRFTRELFVLSRQVPHIVFVQTVQRALRYRIVHLETLRRIAWLCISQGEYPLPEAQVDEDFQQRPAYQEGFLTDEPDLSIYDDMLKQQPGDQSEDQDPNQESEDHNG